jgi:uncharacterized protein YutE (UPF0331/DUF86 family)
LAADRERPRPDSDLDLAVDDGHRLTAGEKLMDKLAERTGQPVDVVDLHAVGEPLLGQILRHGNRLLGSETCYADLIRRHLFDQTDYLPYRNRILAERRRAEAGMDWEVIGHKLESLHHCLQRLTEKCPSNPDKLNRDPDLQDIITLNLSRAVQLCMDLGAHLIADLDMSPPDTMGQTFDVLAHADVIPEHLAQQLKEVVGFKNIAVHHCEEIDWVIVHNIALNHLSDFSEFAKIVAARLPR